MHKKIIVFLLVALFTFSGSACNVEDTSKSEETIKINEEYRDEENGALNKETDEQEDTDKKNNTEDSESGLSSNISNNSSLTSSDSKKQDADSNKDKNKVQSHSKDKDNNKSPDKDNSSVKPSDKNTTNIKKEKTVTVKYPIYGELYTVYWIKDDLGNIIYETKDAKEWDEKCLECWDKGMAITYGSEGKNDIIGYETTTMTESEWEKSLWKDEPNCIVTFN